MMHEGDKANLVNANSDGADPNLQDNAASQTTAPTAGAKRSVGVRCPNSVPKGMTLIVLISVIFSAAVTIALILTIIFGEPQVQKLGGVAADTAEASQCGLEMLSNGGSAVDAAVAAALCGAVVQYPVSGLGGGGLLLVHDHRGDKTTLFDFLPAAPKNLSAGMLSDGGAAAIDTALGTGVPGFVKGLEEAHRRFGRLKWSSLVSPSIRLASGGFLVSADLNRLVVANLARLVSNPLLKRWFLTDTGAAKPVGATITMPELASALSALRDQGPAAMYTGSLADEFLTLSTAKGGRLTKADLAEYRVLERTPLVGHYRNFTLRTFPPPALGGAYTLLVAQVLAGYPGTLGPATAPVNTTQLLYHRAAEAMKLALGAVQPLGDGPASMTEAASLVTPAYADRLRSLIQDTRVIGSTGVWPPAGLPASSQLVAVDNDELYVAMETSVNTPFATRLVTADTGLLLNNALAGFAPPSAGSNHSNAPAPGKRPATLMSPGFAFNPRQRCGLRFAFGASNSSSVPGIAAWLVARMSDLASDPVVCPGGGPSAANHRDASSRRPCLPASAAVSSGRINPLLLSAPSLSGLEAETNKLPVGVSEFLSALGHNLSSQSAGLGRAQVIAMDMYSLAAQSDSFRSPGANAATLPQRGG